MNTKTKSRPGGRPNAGGPKIQRETIGRALKYLTRYRSQAILPYIFLLIATLSQLAVPRMVRNVIDAVTNSVISKTMLDQIAKIPALFVTQALPKILEFLKLPADWSLDQVTQHLQQKVDNAPNDILVAGILIVGLPHCAGCSLSCKPIGVNGIRKVWPLTCAMSSMPRCSACPSPIMTALKPVS